MEAASAMSMDRLFGKIKQLPTIPQLLHELMQSFNDENARIDEIAAKIAMDQVISVKVLRMANSAALRRGNEVTSIEQAVIRLGFNRLRSVVVASGIISSFKAPPGFDKHRFWTQTFQVATIARTLAQQTKAVDPESAFTCALIHNIGELLIQTGAPELAAQLNRSGKTDSAQRVALETLQLGFGFPEVGAELARRWQLPKIMQDAIAYQGKPSQAPADMPLPRLIAQAVQIAETVRAHGGVNDEAKEALIGPLFEDIDRDKLFADLEASLEADKAFAELLS